jgi:hypothetical protein
MRCLRTAQFVDHGRSKQHYISNVALARDIGVSQHKQPRDGTSKLFTAGVQDGEMVTPRCALHPVRIGIFCQLIEPTRLQVAPGVSFAYFIPT